MIGAALGLHQGGHGSLGQRRRDQDTKGWSISLFGEYVPVENAYIDLPSSTTGRTSTTRPATAPIRRAPAGGDFNSNPSGNQFGASFVRGLSVLLPGGSTASPYVRAEYVTAKIDSFSESGGVGRAWK